MSPVSIRPATAQDAGSIARIDAANVAATQVDADKPAPRMRVWRDAIEFGEPQVLVACAGDAIIGFVGYDRSRDPGTPPTLGEIWAIHVVDNYLGQGVGLALWDGAREGLLEEGCTHVSIWIELAQERALRFHELAGFKRDMASLRTTAKGAKRVEEIRLKRAL